jgi:hypothetical protein
MEGSTNGRRKPLVAALTILGIVVASVVGAQSSVAAGRGPAITTFIPNLNAPRGLAVDGDGSLYVSESGSPGAGPAGLTQTGKVSKYLRGSTNPVWSTGFESFYATNDPTQPPDVLGPEGIGALGKNCTGRGRDDGSARGDDGRRRGDDGKRNGCQIRLIMSESHDGIAAASGGQLNATQAGLLFALDGATGRAAKVSDVGDQMYKWTGDRKSLFPDDFPDSNPYGVLVTRDRGSEKVRTFVADAGANTINEVMADGTLRVIAYIPNETAPPLRDATPTCIAQGPDGMLYVATLHFVANLFVFGSGQSDVWRVDPNANYPTVPSVWARGLTTPTACTFDRSGNFWAAEMFQPNAAGPPGDVVRIPFRHPDQLQRIGGGVLPLPGAIVQGADGAMYVGINSANPAPNSGAIMRIQTGDSGGGD